MGIKKELIEIGFFLAHGTREVNLMRMACPSKTPVPSIQPFKWNRNSGVFMISDDNGHIWIIPSQSISSRQQKRLINDYEIERGYGKNGYVPHSNDGMFFMRNLIRMGVKDWDLSRGNGDTNE